MGLLGESVTISCTSDQEPKRVSSFTGEAEVFQVLLSAALTGELDSHHLEADAQLSQGEAPAWKKGYAALQVEKKFEGLKALYLGGSGPKPDDVSSAKVHKSPTMERFKQSMMGNCPPQVSPVQNLEFRM